RDAGEVQRLDIRASGRQIESKELSIGILRAQLVEQLRVLVDGCSSGLGGCVRWKLQSGVTVESASRCVRRGRRVRAGARRRELCEQGIGRKGRGHAIRDLACPLVDRQTARWCCSGLL